MSAKSRIARKPVPERGKPAAKETESQGLTPVTWTLIALAGLGVLLYALRLWVTPIHSWDLWYHLKTGEWILDHRRVPNVDIFSECFYTSAHHL